MTDTDRLKSTGSPASPNIIVADDPLVGLNLGGYVVTRMIASGGMGLVYEAKHETIGRRAAVKVLKPEVAKDEQWTKRFLTEARAIASLNHKNIVEVLNFGNTPDGRQYMMMAYLEGKALDKYLAQCAPLVPADALRIVVQVLNGLAEAHKKGVVHRDLKPSNVWLVPEHSGETLVKILDFGLARQDPVKLSELTEVSREAAASILAGTPEYIAPEQAQGLHADRRADLYSLGIMLFEMLTGKLPFASTSVTELLDMHLRVPAPRVSGLVEVPVELDAFVASLLEKKPDDRPESADLARVAVNRLLNQLSNQETALRPFPRKPMALTEKIDRAAAITTDQVIERAMPRRRWPLGVGAGVVVLLVGVAVWRVLTVEPPASTPEAVPRPVVVPAVALPAPSEVAPVHEAPAELTPKVDEKPAAVVEVARPADQDVSTPHRPKPRPVKDERRPEPTAVRVAEPSTAPHHKQCLQLEDWRENELATADIMEQKLRERLRSEGRTAEEASEGVESLHEVKVLVDRAATANECDRATDKLRAWGASHGM